MLGDPQPGPLQEGPLDRATRWAGCNVPIVTINAWVQLLVPPPKYHVTVARRLRHDRRGRRSTASSSWSAASRSREEPDARRARSTGCSRTPTTPTRSRRSPPSRPRSSSTASTTPTLRKRERAILESAIAKAWRVRLRVSGHGWSDLIPNLVARRSIDSASGSVTSSTVVDGTSPRSERSTVAEPIA